MVNATTANSQQYSSVTYRGSRFTVAWSGNGDGDSWGVFIRSFLATSQMTASHAVTPLVSVPSPLIAAPRSSLNVDPRLAVLDSSVPPPIGSTYTWSDLWSPAGAESDQRQADPMALWSDLRTDKDVPTGDGDTGGASDMMSGQNHGRTGLVSARSLHPLQAGNVDAVFRQLS